MIEALIIIRSTARGARGRLESRHSLPSVAALMLLLGALSGLSSIPGRAQEKPKEKPLFLIARPIIADPFFAKSVVLMIPAGENQIVVGLVVNKPTRLPLSQLFPKSSALKNRSELAYLGGPVEMEVPALVFHSAQAPKDAIPIYDDVYLSFDGKRIVKELEDPKPLGEMRLFLGRAQWAPAQLDGEALDGSWYSLRTEGGIIFDHDSENLWKRLHDRAHPSEHIEYRLPGCGRTSPRLSAAAFHPLFELPFADPGARK